MSQTNSEPTTSRRALLAGIPAVALIGAVAAPAVAAVAQSSPDAELIALCGQFNALERQIQSIPGDAAPGSKEEAHADARRDALTGQQGPEPYVDGPLLARRCAVL